MILDENKQLVSDLWLDHPDAHERIDDRCDAGEFDADDAERLHHFADHGFAILSTGLDQGFFAAFDDGLDELWDQRPPDLSFGQPGPTPRRSFATTVPDDRAPGYRLADLHSHHTQARQLYLSPTIMRTIELIYDRPAVAFQSLYFEHGSEQALHRDPMFVITDPPSHLLASWTALEDIEADSGPLMYVAGSHRLPWFETGDDTIAFSGRSGPDVRHAWATQRARMIEENGLEVAEVACRQGDTFIWHAGLLHGGRKIQNTDRTRKSFVVHYCTRDNYPSRTARMAAPGESEGTWRTITGETAEVVCSGNYVGLQNPLFGVDTEI